MLKRIKHLLTLITGLLSTQAVIFAQLCTGSLGDPVVHISFGTGSNPGPPLAGSKTTYKYLPSSCPNDGEYSIINQTFNCFGGSWHTVIGDHTPNDGNGFYMAINASTEPGDFYVDTVQGLCPNTNYEFGAWILNILKPTACNNSGIMPNLTFRIETLTGTVLTTYNSGDIAHNDRPIWVQHGVFFQTPVGVSSVVIRLTNNSPGGCGNDLLLDDITFRPCGPQVTAGSIGGGIKDLRACESNRVTFTLSGGYSPGIYNNPQFQWQESIDGGVNWRDIPGATTLTYVRPPSANGSYFYRMLIADAGNINNISCRLASNTVTVTITQPNVQVTNYVFSCFGSTVVIMAAGGIRYEWTGPASFTSTLPTAYIPNVQFTHTGRYYVTAYDDFGCYDTASTYLTVYPAANLTVNRLEHICEGDSVQLIASGGTRYFWEPAKGLSNDTIPAPFASPKDSTVYRLVIMNQYNCYDTASIKVNVWRRPIADAGPDRKMRLGYPVAILGAVAGTDVSYYWSPPNYLNSTSNLKPLANPPQTLTYRLNASSNKGCGTDTDDVIVKVYEKILIPNAFSPNGDGINDTWIVDPLEFFEESVTEIYDRYGQVVFRSKGYPKPWDGTRNGNPLPTGTYYYVIRLNVNKEPPLTGWVYIVR